MASDFRAYIGRTVLVQLDEHTLTGTLIRETSAALTLADASLVPDQGDPTEMDGHVIIPTLRVLWVQAA